jgi:hypothetical protein
VGGGEGRCAGIAVGRVEVEVHYGIILSLNL